MLQPSGFRRSRAQRVSIAVTGTEPITVAQVKVQARIEADNTSHDAEIEALIPVAREVMERMLGRAIVKSTITLFQDAPGGAPMEWWEGVKEGAESWYVPREIKLPRPPLIAVNSVSSFDDADTETTMPSTDYLVDKADQINPGRLVLRNGAAWPTALRPANAIKIVYTAGYEDANSTPALLKHGLKMLAFKMFETRGDGCSPEECAEQCGVMGVVGAFKVLEIV